MPEPDEQLPSLDALQQKIDQAKADSGMKKQGASGAGAGEQGVATAMRLGMELVAGVGVGSAFGYFVDRWLHTMPLFFIICFFLGAAAGFRNMLRDAGKNTDK